jgi:hypothetical protein
MECLCQRSTAVWHSILVDFRLAHKSVERRLIEDDRIRYRQGRNGWNSGGRRSAKTPTCQQTCLFLNGRKGLRKRVQQSPSERSKTRGALETHNQDEPGEDNIPLGWGKMNRKERGEAYQTERKQGGGRRLLECEGVGRFFFFVSSPTKYLCVCVCVL